MVESRPQNKSIFGDGPRGGKKQQKAPSHQHVHISPTLAGEGEGRVPSSLVIRPPDVASHPDLRLVHVWRVRYWTFTTLYFIREVGTT